MLGNNQKIPGCSALIVWGFLVAGCASVPSDREADHTRYMEASEAMEAGQNDVARARLDELVDGNPDNRFGRQALIDRAYLSFAEGDMDGAQADAEQFLDHYPSSSQAAYAQYLIGMAAFTRWEESQRYDGHREPEFARAAFAEFRTLVEGHPESRYVDTGIERMIAIRDALAGHELDLARAKLEAGQHEQAIARAAYVAENYRESKVVADALALQVEAHEQLENSEQAAHTRRILNLHFPEYAERDQTPDLIDR